MIAKESKCELCNLPVKVEGFILKGPEGSLAFCCEGCLSVYKMLNFDQNKNAKKNSGEKT